MAGQLIFQLSSQPVAPCTSCAHPYTWRRGGRMRRLSDEPNAFTYTSFQPSHSDFRLSSTMRAVTILIFSVFIVRGAELSDMPITICLDTLRTWSRGCGPTSSLRPVGSTTDVGSASTTPTLADLSGTSSSISTLSVSSERITSTTSTSHLLTSQSNSTSLLPLPPLPSRTGTSTSSDPTGVSGPSPSDTMPPSSSPNAWVIAAMAGGWLFALMLLLLGMCLYRYRRKRSAEVVEQFHPDETKAEETLQFPPPYPAHPRSDSTALVVTPYRSINSHESSVFTCQFLHSEARMTSGTAFSPDITPSYSTTFPCATPEPVEHPPPMYRDEAEAQIQSQRIRAEEAERVRRYDALIADFCSSNRDLISPALEHKLHAARYLPEDNPSDVAADYWHTTYGVGFFELRRLQTAYERYVATQALE